MFYRLSVALLAAVILAQPANAHSHEAGHLVIGHPWSRPAPAGRPIAAAYLSITNNGAVPDALVSASSPLAASVQMHQTTLSEGMARMRPLQEVEIAPGKTVKIEPGGIHLMLVGLTGPLAAGTTVPLTLQFRVAGSVTVALNIEERDIPPAAEKSMTQTLGLVTVVACRPSSLPTQIPTTIEGITGETAGRSINATDSEDALKYLPGLNVRKRYTGDFDHAVLASRTFFGGLPRRLPRAPVGPADVLKLLRSCAVGAQAISSVRRGNSCRRRGPASAEPAGTHAA
jgi:copper(I)-binding protein